MAGTEWADCVGCGGMTVLPQSPGNKYVPECGTCKRLGDRSLVRLLKDPTPERIARFLAASPGSVTFPRRNYAKP
jgi:hypothetical protein